MYYYQDIIKDKRYLNNPEKQWTNKKPSFNIPISSNIKYIILKDKHFWMEIDVSKANTWPTLYKTLKKLYKKSFPYTEEELIKWGSSGINFYTIENTPPDDASDEEENEVE